MSFVNGLFLAGLAGAVLPILIHIFTRDRIQKVAFSTFRFFVKSAGHVLRKKRVEEAILLAMRVIACALLALAFARPYFQSAADASGVVEAERARVLLVDLSASMEPQAELLREHAVAALDELSSATDAAALITFTGHPEVVQPFTREFAGIRSQLNDLEVGSGGTNYVEALRRANAICGTARARVKEVVLITDMQRAGWRTFRGGWRFSPGVKLIIKPLLPAANKGNLAIQDADIPHTMVVDKEPRALAVRLANFSDKERRDVKVSLTLADKEVDKRVVHLKAGHRVEARFRRVFDKPGDHTGRITVESKDSRPLDNVLHFNVRVSPKIKVLVLNGRPDRDPMKDAAFFLSAALAPIEDGPFDLSVVQANKATAESLTETQVAILSNVSRVSSPVRKALSDLLQRGGGILHLPGDQVKAETFNNQFSALAPCSLRRPVMVQTSRGEQDQASLTRVDYNHSIFEIFLRPHHGDLSTPKFRRFWEVTDSQLARVLARFDAGHPAFLEKDIGTGVAMLFVSPVSMEWNNLPLRAIFLPWLHQTVRYLAIRTERHTAFRVGEHLPAEEGQSIKDPEGESSPGADYIARMPGLHPLLAKDGSTVTVYAVNCDPQEADPETIKPEEVQAAVAAASDDAFANTGESVEQEKRDGSIWWYVVLAISMLLVGELFLGNRVVRN